MGSYAKPLLFASLICLGLGVAWWWTSTPPTLRPQPSPNKTISPETPTPSTPSMAQLSPSNTTLPEPTSISPVLPASKPETLVPELELSARAQLLSLRSLDPSHPWTPRQSRVFQSLHQQLRQQPNAEVLKGLLRLTRDWPTEHPAQLSLLRIFGDLRYEPARPWLQSCLEHPNASLSSEALLSLAQLGDRSIEDTARTWSLDPQADRRENSLMALALVGGAESLEHLNAHLHNFPTGARSQVQRTQERIRQRLAAAATNANHP